MFAIVLSVLLLLLFVAPFDAQHNATTTFVNVTSTSTFKHLCRHHPVDRVVLKAQHAFSFPWIEAELQRIATNVSPDRFVALRPTKLTNGGYGNVLFHLLEVLGMAVGSTRYPVFNQAAFHALFQHPLHGQVGGNWSSKSNDEVLDFYNNKNKGYYDLRRCGEVAQHSLKEFGDHFYIDACLGNGLKHPEIQRKLTEVFHKTNFAFDGHMWWWSTYAHLAHWALSKPQPALRDAIDTRVRAIKDLCFQNDSSSGRSVDDPIDVAVHARVFLGSLCHGFNSHDCDMKLQDRYSQSPGFKIYYSCILQQMREAALRKAASSYPDIAQRPICVFLTADAPRIEKVLKTALLSNLGPQLRASIVTSSELQKHLNLPRSPVAVSPQTGRPTFVSSDYVMNKMRDTANTTEILQYPEFALWGVLRAALSVVRTGESTFSQMARLSNGFLNLRHDFEVIPWSDEYVGKNLKWKCVRSLDKQLVCDYCVSLFGGVGGGGGGNSTAAEGSASAPAPAPASGANLCPVDVIEDCRVAICDKCLSMGTATCPKNLTSFCDFKV